eukprot:COSAG02_NODE_4967_length_4773_cov_44.423834_4_plen_100_part_00
MQRQALRALCCCCPRTQVDLDLCQVSEPPPVAELRRRSTLGQIAPLPLPLGPGPRFQYPAVAPPPIYVPGHDEGVSRGERGGRAVHSMGRWQAGNAPTW